jgi:5-methylcytosine-specific restriction enzyme A
MNKNPTDAKFIASRAWREHIRPKQLRDHPLCELCRREGRYVAAEEIDHIQRPLGDPQLQRDPSNFMSLCKSHHSRKTRTDNRGYGLECDPHTGFMLDPNHPSNRRPAMKLGGKCS